jgi:hemolysin III
MNDDLLASAANGGEPHSEKPRLRGVLHQWAAVGAVVAGAALFYIAVGIRSSVASAVYSLSLLILFSVSATYHRVNWGLKARMRMRRLDHAAIFVLIAGSYTPIALIALGGGDGTRLCVLAWSCAAVGIIKSIFWSGSPKWVTATLAVAAGWCIVPYLSAVARALDTMPLFLLFGGGIVYTVGALAYASRRPNPVVGVFGYHEVFHACTVIAAALHFAAVAWIVRGAS